MTKKLEMTRKNNSWLVILGVFVMVFLFTFLMVKSGASQDEAIAADLSKFDAGYIMSDYQMGNYTSMTEAEIQAFLTKKNPCGNTNYNLYLEQTSLYPNTKWNFKDGHFVCLSEELFGDGMVTGEGETAARIIWQAAQDYKINPQVLIVLLQKEQGLITDDFPNSVQYRSATGYGCPDNAPCAEEYYGFKNQVRKAAALFRAVLDGGWTNYPLGENYVLYNPSESCGGSVVNIRNLATSALYRYTPYQPNAETLAAGYGSGVYCGAYGNRNFYLYFEDWFGGIVAEEPTEPVEPEAPEVTEPEVKPEVKPVFGVMDYFAGDGLYDVSEENAVILGVSKNTTMEDFVEGLKLMNGGSAKMFKGEVEILAGDLVGTGMAVILYDAEKKVVSEFEIVVEGDVSGDGKVSYLDYVKIYNHIQDAKNPEAVEKMLSGVYLTAADVSGDGKITYLDYVKVYNKIKEV